MSRLIIPSKPTIVQEHMSGSYAYLSLNADQILEILLHTSKGRLINAKTAQQILTMVAQSTTLVPVVTQTRVKKWVKKGVQLDSTSELDSLMRLLTLQVQPLTSNVMSSVSPYAVAIQK
jgi:hypothetical protein